MIPIFLIPKEIRAKLELTERFIEIKKREYEELLGELESLKEMHGRE